MFDAYGPVRETPESPSRLLTRHFLRRLLDNDVIAPNADRHETLTVGATLLISAGLFVSVIIASKYVINPFPTPVHMALGAMHDRYVFIGASMLVMALVAAAQWDALALDVRDASILGPLPVTRWTIVRAKLASLAIFSTGFALIMNAGPSVLFPLFYSARFPHSPFDMGTMLFAHALVTTSAGAFGLACVIALRETMRALLGARVFARVSTLLQAALVVVCGTTLLLLPGTGPRAMRASLEGRPVAAAAMPPLWFSGLHEVLTGHIVSAVRARDVPPAIAARERLSVDIYRRNGPQFRRLAAAIVPAFAAIAGVAFVAFLWNHRRLPLGAPMRSAGRTRWRLAVSSAVERVIVPDPAAQAGFFFTLQVLPRSPAHRVAMATATAAGLAGVALAAGSVQWVRGDPWAARLPVWAAQTMLLTALLFGFRHASRVPAELKASASFLMAWGGRDRAYLAGVRRAVLIAFALPAIAVLFPAHVVLFGLETALLHAAAGLAFAFALLAALCHRMAHPPFVCAYVPATSMKRAAPIYLAGLLLACHVFAGFERAALRSTTGFVVLVGALIGLALLLGLRDRRDSSDAPPIEIDQTPEGAVRLGLHS